MESARTYLFVYGTLRRGFSSPILDLLAGDIEWKGKAVIKGELYNIGDYPGATPSKNGKSIVVGELIEILKPEKVWNILDQYEGCDNKNDAVPEYVRRKELVQLADDEIIEAWIYWYNLPVTGKRRIRSNDYLKYLRKKQLA